MTHTSLLTVALVDFMMLTDNNLCIDFLSEFQRRESAEVTVNDTQR